MKALHTSYIFQSLYLVVAPKPNTLLNKSNMRSWLRPIRSSVPTPANKLARHFLQNVFHNVIFIAFLFKQLLNLCWWPTVVLSFHPCIHSAEKNEAQSRHWTQNERVGERERAYVSMSFSHDNYVFPQMSTCSSLSPFQCVFPFNDILQRFERTHPLTS